MTKISRIILVLGTLVSAATGIASAVGGSSFVSYPLVPHHVQQNRRRLHAQDRQLEEAMPRGTSRRQLDLEGGHAQQVGALYQGYGTHYIDLWCGTPPQRQTVIVDTGSSVTAFPCAQCFNCGVPDNHIDELFDENQSSTFRHNDCDHCVRGACSPHDSDCTISMNYQEGSSWTAFEAMDNCYVGGPHYAPVLEDKDGADIDPNHAGHFAFQFVFGCQIHLTGLFITQLADGIMGMDFGNEAFWSQMYEAGKMGDKQQFALCFSRQPLSSRSGTEAGALTLGGADTRLHDTPLVWSGFLNQGTGFFHVNIRAVYLRSGEGGESAISSYRDATVVKLDVGESSLNVGKVIVDSGTTDTYWNRAISTPFKALFREMTGRMYSNSPMTLTEEEVLSFPTILFQLHGDEEINALLFDDDDAGMAGSLDPDHPYDVMLAFPPSHYMEYDPRTQKYTGRFYVTEDGGSVLGANAMMGHDVLFDVDSNRIGWAESHCDYTKLTTEAGYPSVLEEDSIEVEDTETEQQEVESDETESEQADIESMETETEEIESEETESEQVETESIETETEEIESEETESEQVETESMETETEEIESEETESEQAETESMETETEEIESEETESMETETEEIESEETESEQAETESMETETEEIESEETEYEQAEVESVDIAAEEEETESEDLEIEQEQQQDSEQALVYESVEVEAEEEEAETVVEEETTEAETEIKGQDAEEEVTEIEDQDVAEDVSGPDAETEVEEEEAEEDVIERESEAEVEEQDAEMVVAEEQSESEPEVQYFEEDGTGNMESSTRTKKVAPIQDEHENQSPIDDIKVQLSNVAEACDSWLCRIGVLASMVLALFLGVCCGRCCCSSRSTKHYRRAATEMELPNNKFVEYRDEPEFDDYDQEYGSNGTP